MKEAPRMSDKVVTVLAWIMSVAVGATAIGADDKSLAFAAGIFFGFGFMFLRDAIRR